MYEIDFKVRMAHQIKCLSLTRNLGTLRKPKPYLRARSQLIMDKLQWHWRQPLSKR